MPPLRRAAVVTHLRCNQACRYCDRRAATDDLAFIQASAVRARIQAAAGSPEIVLTGGEPTLRGDLDEIIKFTCSIAAEVGVETNATLITPERARALAAAGLTFARVNLAGIDARLDELTQDPGGFERTKAGLLSLAEAGIRIEVTAAIVRATAAWLPSLPALIAPLGPALRFVELSVPVDGPGELSTFEEAAETLAAVDAAARPLGVAVRLASDSGPPPCVFPPRQRLQHLYSLTPGVTRRPRHTQVAACGECLVADRCSGLPDAYLARHAPPPMHAISDERLRRRLSLISTVPEQIARELVSTSMFTDATGAARLDEIVRINFHCNQACAFCFVSTWLPPAPPDEVEARIRAAAARGSRIVLSGGEPTLNPRLADYVRLAKSLGGREVTLQTNAVRLDDSALTASLAAAGLDEAFVSLHAVDAETSDAITEALGTFVRTLAGIDELRRAGLRVTLNFVICNANRRQSPDFVRLVAARWPGAPISFSFIAASTDLVPRALVPRYSDVLPSLAEASVEAHRLGVELVGFEGMCGLPLCLVPQPLAARLAEIPAGFGDGEFIHTATCDGCAERRRCYGMRRAYAELHGTDELRAR
jgi:MoaA/NifB/PqqE/SkfB family radical SAM enzyme